MYIRISVNNKIAAVQDNVLIVNGNSDYVIKFDFDSEWDAYQTKTARFMTARGYTDVVFSGDEVALPVIQNERYIRIGVYAGDLRTTTSAVIFCRRCITDGSGSPADPTPDVYAQLMALLNDRIGIWYPTVDDAGNMSWEKSDTEEAPAPTNIKGPIGETGAQGSQGEKGPKGDKGDTGAQGPKGDTGPTGPEGPQGPKGDAFTYADFTETQLLALKGPKGDKGDKGDTGSKGDTGAQGPKGDTGDTGPQGERGPQGEQGIQGPAGNDGYTPVKGVDYFDGVKGDKGDKGDTGATGAQGPKGDKGDTGPQGPQGPKGDTGPSGATGAAGKDGYTPVRGTDYWTADDIAAIQSYIDEKAAALQPKSITDSGGHFTTDTVEGALQEIGAELAGINTLLGSGIQISFTIDGETFSAVSGETWKEWVGTSRVISEISGLTLYCFSDDGIIFADEAGVNALGLNDVWVHGNETIVPGATYAIIPCGG